MNEASLQASMARPSQQSLGTEVALRKSITQKMSQPSVDELASASIKPEAPLSAVDSKLGVEVTVTTRPLMHPTVTAKPRRRKSRGASAKVPSTKLTRAPKATAAAGSNL